MGLRGSPDQPGDTNDTNSSQQLKGVAAHVASTLLGGLAASNGTSGGQFPFVDPNVLMMTNAAATIAAVAASAVQQMTQGKQSHGVSGGGNSPVPPGLGGAFAGSAGRALLTSHAVARAPGSGNNGQLSHQQVAAFLGGGGGQSSLGFQLTSPPSSHTGSSSRPGITSSQTSFPAPSSGSMSSVLLPGMQTWTLEQIGRNNRMMMCEPECCNVYF
jgi:hypothetical protein